MLTVDALTVRLGKRTILSDLSFCAEDGLTMLIGPNGSGKSTLIRAILGSIPHESGRIRLNGADLDALSVRQRARRIAYLPQRQTIPPRVRAVDYVALGSCPESGVFSPVSGAARTRAAEKLEALDIGALKYHFMDELSGGEARLTALARAMMQENAYLLLDEPLAGLDFGRQQAFLSMLKNRRVSGLMSIHDPLPAWQYGDHILILNAGTVAPVPPNDKAAYRKAIRQLYGTDIALP